MENYRYANFSFWTYRKVGVAYLLPARTTEFWARSSNAIKGEIFWAVSGFVGVGSGCHNWSYSFIVLLRSALGSKQTCGLEVSEPNIGEQS
mgnify:CR=1 FL=1